MQKVTRFLVVALIFLSALSLRLFGINWDQGQHLHPDERFLTMVLNDTGLPSSVSEYFSTASSPLNPYNYQQFQFFVYGTFPIFLTKFIGAAFGVDTYDKVFLLGRGLSALFDALNIITLFFLAKAVIPEKKYVLLPALLYAFCVLPIQLSHFFAVDTFLAFFLLLTFTLLVYNRFALAALAFGAALSCKITAVIFVPVIVLFLIKYLLSTKKIFSLLLITVFCLLISFIVFRIFQPYAFTGLLKINPHFISNIRELQAMSRADSVFPPSVQWLSKTPLLYSAQNLILWGIGLPLSIIFGFSLLRFRTKSWPAILVLLWIGLVYFYQGSQFAHNMRYFLPIYPFICLAACLAIKKIPSFIFKPAFLFHIIWALLFVSIYTRPHSRVQASQWMYDNFPSGSRLTNEYWDDPLPLYLSGHDPYIYSGTMLGLYDEDNPEKWRLINSVLASTNFMIMSSNRLWGSIPLVPDRYPETSTFYRNLFDGRLEFKKMVEINSYPGINLPFLKDKCFYFGPTNFPGSSNSWFSLDTCRYPGFFIRDDIAEESFTVYDHPKVLVFSRK